MNSIEWGFRVPPPIYGNFVKMAITSTGDKCRKISYVHKPFFDRKKSAHIIQGKVQGVVGGGENPFSPHDFFLFFFIFSDYQNLFKARIYTVERGGRIWKSIFRKNGSINVVHTFWSSRGPPPINFINFLEKSNVQILRKLGNSPKIPQRLSRERF